MRDDKIEEMFGKRGEVPLYEDIENNKFYPLLISSGQIEGIKDLAKDKNIPDILNRQVERMINRMEKDMMRIKLNKDFDLDINNYLLKPQKVSELVVPNIPVQVSDANA